MVNCSGSDWQAVEALTRSGCRASLRCVWQEDLVGPAVFLCSDATAYVTGQVLYVDGGHLASI
jgi:enoyl-[acyl-carrier-protein] reductase (NADH)